MPSSDANDGKPHTSPWIPLSMLAITTAALAFPIALLRRRQRTATSIVGGGRYPSSSPLTSMSKMDSAPPVRRRPQRPPPHRGDAGSSAIPLPSRMRDDASAQTKPLAKAGSLFRAPSGVASLRTPRVEEDSSFDGALYSLKAFSIATTFVVAGGAASVWGVKTYLGVKDTQEFASTMRLTILDKWPLLTSRIHRTALSDSTIQYPPRSHSHPPPDTSSSLSASESLDSPRYPLIADERSVALEVEMDKDDEEWNWPAAQERLATAYEHGGIAQFAETAVRELEAELELERRKRRVGNVVEGQS